MQRLQPTQAAASTRRAGLGFVTAMHGDSKITAETPWKSAASRTAETACARLSGSAFFTHATPTARSTFSMLTFWLTSPIMVLPVPGWGWWPVMAVVELSSTISTMSCSL